MTTTDNTTTLYNALTRIEELEHEQNAIAKALDHHILLAKADALDSFADNWPWGEFHPDESDVRDEAKRLRRQAEGS